MKAALIAACAGLLPAAPRPDMIPPGHAQVTHVLVFEELDLPEGLELVATPTRGFGGVEVVEAGTPVRFSSKYGTRLYLAPEGAIVEPPSAGTPLDYPVASPPVGQVSSVPMIHATRRIETFVALDGVHDDTLQLRVTREARLDASGAPVGVRSYLPWVGLAVLGVGVLWGLRRRRQATAAA